MRSIALTPIGIVRTPFTEHAGTPIQGANANGTRGRIEVEPEFIAAMQDLDGFERIWLICYLDRVGPYRPVVVPYLDDTPRGVFATRAPSRPNPIGLSLVRVISVEENRIDVEGVDLLDGTPVLDIKPYVPEFDAISPSRAGWFETAKSRRTTADDRFAPR